MSATILFRFEAQLLPHAIYSALKPKQQSRLPKHPYLQPARVFTSPRSVCPKPDVLANSCAIWSTC